jgi:hypothetical protein
VANYSKKRIAVAFADSDNADTTTERGRLLESLVAYLFSKCSGVRHFENNALNAAGSSEVDVCFWNSREPGSIDFLPQILIVECKNTAERVGSAAVTRRASSNQRMNFAIGSWQCRAMAAIISCQHARPRSIGSNFLLKAPVPLL